MNAPLRTIVLYVLLGAGAAGILFHFLNNPVRVEVDTGAPDLPEAPPTPLPQRIDFDLLKQTVPDHNYRPVYPEELEQLDGQHVTLRGFMTPYDDLVDLTVFMIMSFPTGCNFCAPPSVNQVVLTRQPEPKPPMSANRYVDGPIEVSGTLRLWSPESTDPAHRDEYFLYIMEHAQVRSIPMEEYEDWDTSTHSRHSGF